MSVMKLASIMKLKTAIPENAERPTGCCGQSRIRRRGMADTLVPCPSSAAGSSQRLNQNE
jgi:hypothetical protein